VCQGAYPVVHEQVLDDEVGHQGLEGCGKLLGGQQSQVAQRGERRDQLLQVARVQTLVQGLQVGEGGESSRVTWFMSSITWIQMEWTA